MVSSYNVKYYVFLGLLGAVDKKRGFKVSNDDNER